jgi:16S rRNA (guanine527-N7)-methyltransferase
LNGCRPGFGGKEDQGSAARLRAIFLTTQNDDALFEELVSASSALGVPLNDQQVGEVKTFCQLIIEYSSHTNIVGKAETSVLLQDHVLDSLALVPFLLKANSGNGAGKLIDVGSGAGFPAIILSIALPQAQVLLIESAGKKCRFLEQAVKTLKLKDRVTVLSARAEEVGHDLDYRGRFDWGTARAVGTFDMTAELVMPFLRIGGYFFAQKSFAQKEEEAYRAKKSLPLLGGKLSDVRTLDETILGKSRILLIAEKKEITPAPFARVFTKIKSEPLVK